LTSGPRTVPGYFFFRTPPPDADDERHLRAGLELRSTNVVATPTQTVQVDDSQGGSLASSAGLIAVATGVGAILLLALAALFLLAFKVSAPTDAMVAVATGAFGVIGSVVGAYFGVKVGTDQTKPMAAAAETATQAAARANVRSEAIALHVAPDLADRAMNAANTAVSALRSSS
jgi:uncharacterized membrane protein YfcA